MKKFQNIQGGFGLIKLIIVAIVVILILSWYGVDIKNFINSPQVQNNFGFIWNFIDGIWTNYLAGPAIKLWGIILQYIWEPFTQVILKK